MPLRERIRSLALGLAVACAASATRALADMEVLIPGGSRTILATATDTLVTGETIRGDFDKLFWFPDASQDQGHLFMNHELDSPDGGLSRLTYVDGSVTSIENWVIGTHNNCSGNISSWGTILSCEEFPPAGAFTVGYIVEVDPTTPHVWARRHAMGRFSHESIIEDPLTGDIYMTDDQNDGVFFKFIADTPGDLTSGSLYALREPTRDWVLVTDMLNPRDQALALGATARPRPEGLAYNAIDDKIYLSVTGIDGDADSGLGYLMRFDPRTNEMVRWLDGSLSTFANPDNVEIDSQGNLLVHEDKYSRVVAETGPNRLILVRLNTSMMVIMVGLDTIGEVTGLEWGGSDDRFFVCWMGGTWPERHQVMEVNLPDGWNDPPVDVATAAAPRALGLTVAPNPFSVSTRIGADAPAGGPLTLGVFDARGARIRSLDAGQRGAEAFRIRWDGRDDDGRRVAPGTYFVRLRDGDRAVTERVVRLE